jgi:hypothetical protein
LSKFGSSFTVNEVNTNGGVVGVAVGVEMIGNCTDIELE